MKTNTNKKGYRGYKAYLSGLPSSSNFGKEYYSLSRCTNDTKNMSITVENKLQSVTVRGKVKYTL